MPIVVSLLREPEIIMQETFQQLVYQLQDESITRQLAAIEDKESKEYKAIKKAVKQTIIDTTRQEVEENPEFREAASRLSTSRISVTSA